METKLIAKPLISVEEYLTTAYEPDCEYNEGVIEKRKAGEFDHSFIQVTLATVFTNQIGKWNAFALIAQRIQIKPRRFLVPDLTVIRMGTPRERIITKPPLIAIEIMSPEDTMKRAEKKAAEYLEFGVENVWFIDARNEQARAAYRATQSGLQLVAAGELTVAGTPILVRVPELFEKLDQF
jgi:Uma2 family endonuclease